MKKAKPGQIYRYDYKESHLHILSFMYISDVKQYCLTNLYNGNIVGFFETPERLVENMIFVAESIEDINKVEELDIEIVKSFSKHFEEFNDETGEVIIDNEFYNSFDNIQDGNKYIERIFEEIILPYIRKLPVVKGTKNNE